MPADNNPLIRNLDRGAPILVPPTNESGILQNLGWHALFVLDPDFEQSGGTLPIRPLMPLVHGRDDSSSRVKDHAEVLVSAIKLISPAGARRMRPTAPFATAADGYDFSRLFRTELAQLRARTDPRATAIRGHVRSILEASITRWPAAYCRFCREVAAVEPNLPQLLAHLARAAGFAATKEELRCVEQTQIEVSARLQDRIALTAPPPAPAAHATRPPSLQGSAAVPHPDSGQRRHLTRRQQQIHGHCRDLGELFFRHRTAAPGPIEPRLFPLICAPTGAGKSMLVKILAQDLGAHYLRMQRGDMAPQGASRMRATVFTILDALVQHELVLLHLDELDKFTVDQGAPTPSTEWGAGIFSDVWSLLDGSLPFATYLATEDRVRPAGVTVTLELLQRRARSGLFVVGSGTWQGVFTKARRPPMGFGAGTPETQQEVGVEAIIAARVISPELLARFNSDIQILGYPEADEIPGLLEATGILGLARDCHYVITPADLDFARGGFRILETLFSRLLLRRDQMRGQPVTGASPTGSAAISSPPTISSRP